MSSALVHKQSEALLTLGSKPLPRLPNPNPWSSPDFPHLLQSLSAPPHLGLALISPKAWSSECSGLWGCSDPPWHSFGARAVPLRLFRTCFSPGLGEKPPQTARGGQEGLAPPGTGSFSRQHPKISLQAGTNSPRTIWSSPWPEMLEGKPFPAPNPSSTFPPSIFPIQSFQEGSASPRMALEGSPGSGVLPSAEF